MTDLNNDTKKKIEKLYRAYTCIDCKFLDTSKRSKDNYYWCSERKVMVKKSALECDKYVKRIRYTKKDSELENN